MPSSNSAVADLDVVLRDNWGSGIVVDLSLTSAQPLNGWTIAFDYAGEIVNIWNAEVVSKVGDRYTVENVGYNGALAAGATTVFGFQGSGSATEITPASINGVAFDGAGTPTPIPDPMLTVYGDVGTEGDPGGTAYVDFEVRLDAPATRPLTFAYETRDGTATAGADYVAASGVVSFAVGEQLANVRVALASDTVAEDTESFSLIVKEAAGTDKSGVATILDDDGAIPDTGDGGSGEGTVGDSGPFEGGGQTFAVGQTNLVRDFEPTKDILDVGASSIHNQIPVDTPDGFMMMNMFNDNQSLLLQDVYLADLYPESFAPIGDSHLQQDLSAILAYEDGSGLVRANTVYPRSHQAGLVEIVDFNPATDKINFFYLAVRGDGQLNFAVEDTPQGARFYSPLTGQSLTLRDVSFSELASSHFEWRANQLEDNVASRMGLTDVVANFQIVSENVFSGKSVAMAGGVDRAPYHSGQGYEDYTGSPIGAGSGDAGTGGGAGSDTPVDVTVTGGSVTEGDPGTPHVHDDGTSHVHDDGHRFITFEVALSAPATETVTLSYATEDGTAIADTSSDVAWDYHETTGTLAFAPGDRIKTVAVAVHPDTEAEDTETFALRVAGDNVTGVLHAVGTILDSDVAHAGVGQGGSGGHTHDFVDITFWGTHHGTSSHTHNDSLIGGRTPITTEAMLAYNGLRAFLGLADATVEEVGTWAFARGLTNNSQAWGGDLQGVGLWYSMQGAKVGWIDDDAFDPQILADVQREARLGDATNVMAMIDLYGHEGFGDYLRASSLDDHFVNMLKMEPHYGGWMHGRTHGYLSFPEGVAIAHDVNHLTVLSHDQTQPFMNDTFDWPQWPALNVPHPDVIDYFQSMVVLGDPLGDALPAGTTGVPVSTGDLIAQAGETTFDQAAEETWTQVTFDEEMIDPIVTLGPLTQNGGHQAVVRVRDVTSEGFEVQIDEWEYLDGRHVAETISWLAVERGTHTLPDGAVLQAGRAEVSHNRKEVGLDPLFTDAMVLGTVTSDNTPNAVTERFTSVTSESFVALLQEEEAANGLTARETIDWVAFEVGSFDSYTAVRDGSTVDHRASTVSLGGPLASDEFFFAEMQERAGGDTASLRMKGLDGQVATLFVEEEKSADAEVSHVPEEIAWLVIDDLIFG